jgi:hypothetical protein
MTELDQLSDAVQRRCNYRPPRPAPYYAAFLLVATIIGLAGLLVVCVGILVVSSVFGHSPSGMIAVVNIYMVLPVGAGLIVGGLLLVAAAEALFMLRTIARNSFR